VVLEEYELAEPSENCRLSSVPGSGHITFWHDKKQMYSLDLSAESPGLQGQCPKLILLFFENKILLNNLELGNNLVICCNSHDFSFVSFLLFCKLVLLAFY
jgi:hypothetical protein